MDVINNNPFLTLPKVFVFDLCGTILNSKKLDHEAINYTLKKFKKEPWKITRRAKDPLKSMKDNFPNFFGSDSSKAYDIYINYLIDHIQQIELFEHSLENLKIINYTKAQICIITNRDQFFVNALNRNKDFLKIQPYINLILTSDEIGATKPSPKVIEYALKKLNMSDIKNSSIAFVGDALADMNTALGYKCTPILLTASTSDITEKFISKNYSKIYTANSHQEIAHSLIESIKKQQEYSKIKNQKLLSLKSNTY